MDKITVDLSRATIGDLKVLDGVARGAPMMGEMVDFLDRVVVGGAQALPLSEYRAVMDAVLAALSGGGDEGKN